MSRVIKFRAWDTENKKMLWGDIPLRLHSHDGDDWFLLSDDTDSNNDYYENILQQFTGLYDKTGKEIYEGDVVLVNDHIYPKVVNWEKDIHISYGHGESGFSYWSGFLISEYGNELRSLEVIGNIFENPELIKKDV